ncbi:MAG TPA: sugar transferase [Roseiflexaceae bacterium]|nr:sugar transferase [Roseiflexaceae bacterium]
MQVLLIATNEAAKLRPLTDTTPAALLPVVDRPVIALTLELLARAGCRQLLVSLCHEGGALMEVLGDGARWGLKIEYLFQRAPLGPAGALRWAAPRLSETTLLLPADAIVDLDVAAAVAQHHAAGNDLTLVLHRDAARARPVALGPEGHVLGRPTGEAPQGYTGALLIEPSALRHIPAHTPYDDYGQLQPALLAAGLRVGGYTTASYWNPLATMHDYLEAQRALLEGAAAREGLPGAPALPALRRAPFAAQQIRPGVWAAPGYSIDPRARLAPPVYIGEGARIGRAAELGPYVVVGPYSLVDDEASAHHSLLLEHTYVGRWVALEERIAARATLIDAASAVSTPIVDPLLLADMAPRRAPPRWLWLLNRLAALLLLLALAPLLLLVAVLAWAGSGAAPLIRLPRVGLRPGARPDQGPRTFGMWAFRTSRPDGSAGPAGDLLRRWSLDRLPAVWNVLAADMDLVGVKPLAPEQAALLHEPWQQTRFERPAGLTGLWYVQAEPHGGMDAILTADSYYAALGTWRDTVGVLWRTPGAWLRHSLSGGHLREAHAPLLLRGYQTHPMIGEMPKE